MAALSPNFDPQFFDGGAPAAGYLLHTYATGTTTPLTTYQDQAATIPNTNPIVLDAAGRAKLWLVDSAEYRLHLMTPLGATVSGYPIDDVGGVSTALDDAAIRTDLASTASGKGASLSGFKRRSLVGAVEQTVESELFSREFTPMNFGAIGDGVADDTAAIVASFSALNNYDTLDLAGKRYKIYTGNNGVASGDAAALNAIPRIVGKTGVKVKNGEIFAANPGVSGAKVRYPTTLTIDGCTGIRFVNVDLYSRGESFGDSDASLPLGFEDRREFCAKNGGHALLIVRSNGTKAISCNFELSGSVAPLYSMSSTQTKLIDCYSTPKSLGYAAYAFDSWAGPIATSGFGNHEAELHNCRTNAGVATYGSKGGVFAEDEDVVVRVFGGSWQDCYANGGAHFIGAAFTSINSHVIATSPQVHNCASIGLTYHSAAGTSKLEVSGAKATGLRTSMHIQGSESFGDTEISYANCDSEIVGTSLWAELELSVSTVIANRKVASGFKADIINCNTRGANTFAVNNRAVYGGYNVVGGEHHVYNRVFDSLGAGGSAAGTMRGFQISGGAKFVITNPTPAASLVYPASSALSVIRNQDGSAVLTYQLIDFDAASTIESVAAVSVADIGSLGVGLVERIKLLQRCIGCVQAVSPGAPRSGAVRVVSLDGVAGAFYKATLGYVDGKTGDGLTFADDVFAIRRQQGIYSGPVVVAGELQYGVFLNTAVANLTVGAIYPANFSG